MCLGYTFDFRRLSPPGVRIAHGCIFLFSVSVMWFMRSPQMQRFLEEAPDLFPQQCGGLFNNSCIGSFGALRVALAMVLYHAAMAAATAKSARQGDVAGQIHNNWWILKLLLLAGTATGCFFIPPGYIANFFWPAFGLGAAYALWHAMVLIRTGYAWAVVWQGRSQDGGRLYKLGLVGSIVGFFAGVVVLTVLMLMFFNRPTGCEVNLFFIIFNAAAFVLLLVLALLPSIRAKNGIAAVLTTGLVCFFASYLIWSALSSAPITSTHSCNTYATAESSQKAAIYLGMALFYVAIAWRMTGADQRTSAEPDAVRWFHVYCPEDKEDELADTEPTYNYGLFHLELALAATYACVVIIGWNELRERDSSYFVVQSWAATWTKAALSWASLVLLLVYMTVSSARTQMTA